MIMGKVDINNNQLLQVNNSYILGKLVSNTEYLPNIGYEKEPITIMKNSNNVVFYIKPISFEPNYIEENINKYLNSGATYIGVDIHNLNMFPMQYRREDESEKIEIVKSMLEDKLILFKPYININGSKIHKNIKLISIEETNKEHSGYKYTYIPKLDITNEEFEYKFKMKDPIKLDESKYPDLSNIEYIICGDYIYGYIDECKRNNRIIESWIFESENLKKFKIDVKSEEFKRNSVADKSEMVFLERSYLEKLDINLTDEGIDINGKNKGEVNNIVEEHNIIENEVIHLNMNAEIKFLNEFREKTVRNGLYYTKTDLYNFHVSVKTNMLTILAGMSGTGKTQIAKCYVETMGLTKDDKELLFLPISPSYTEPEDLLGYLNTSVGLYMPSSTGLVDLLICAEENQDKMYAIIFDEMNLAQIEHWFAPFISLLEIKSDERFLNLYSEDSICHNKSKYKSRVKIGDNILFIGTVNLDETTRDLSDRVLDRANVITLKKRSFSEIKENENSIKGTNTKKNQNITYKEYQSWIKEKSFIDTFTLEELKFFDTLHDLLSKNGNFRGVSFRVLQGIANYINNIPYDDDEALINRRQAIDLSLKQRILTKVKGSDRELEGIIDTSDKYEFGNLYEFLNESKSKEISDFNESKLKLKQKCEELNKYGYAN